MRHSTLLVLAASMVRSGEPKSPGSLLRRGAPSAAEASPPAVAVLFVGQFIRYSTLESNITEHFGAARYEAFIASSTQVCIPLPLDL